jgi:putative membrane protein
MEPEDPRPRLAYDRTHLANERTLAAWLRTGLAVAAVGFAAIHLLPTAGDDGGVVLLIGGGMVTAGAGVMLFGAWRFAVVSRALGEGASPRMGVRPGAVYLVTTAIALLLLSLLVTL